MIFFFLTPSPQPKTVSETDDQELEQLMARVERENTEVEGDEDSEEED